MSRRLLFSIIVVLLITNITTLLFWLNDQSESDISLDNDKENNKSVAQIEDVEITYEEWMEQLKANYGQQHLKSMIDRTAVEQLAKEKDITISEKVIERELSLLISAQGNLTEDEIAELKEKWREDIQYRYQLEALLTEGVSIPEGEVQNHYTHYRKQYNFTKTLQLSHILLSDMETAEKVRDELDSGASFSQLAKEYSIDEDSRDRGGYIGFFTTTTQFLPNKYDTEAAKLEPYSYSDPFVTDRGVAIIFLHQSLPEITFTYEELQPYIKRELALEKSGQTLNTDQIWEELDINWVFGE